jgi:serine/threonine-protein kinase
MDKTQIDPSRPASSTPAAAGGDPRSLGSYRVLRRLGEGGMGAVYLGYHEGDDARVAIKVLGRELAGKQAFVDRFYREAKSGALLNHPNVVRTLGAGQDGGTGAHYLVMEFIDGPTAQAMLEGQGRLAVGDAVHIALDVARALEHAHSRNVVHRDIKPDNILLTRSGVAKLADLGLAKRLDEAAHLTATRQAFGTTPYMPYEQALNARSADGRSDLYALGATLYHLVTGQVPFPGVSHVEVVQLKAQGAFTPAGTLNPAVPPALDAILAKLLAREPRDRYQTASELIVELERSRLAAAVPSFADPDLALQDPWVRACLASAAEPTRPDLGVPGPPTPQLVEAEYWQVRYRNKEGRPCKARASPASIAQRLRDGRLPADTEVRRTPEEPFQTAAAFPEFRPEPEPAPAPPAPPPRPAGRGKRRAAAEPAAGRGSLLRLLVVVALVLAVVLGALIGLVLKAG